MIGRRTCSVRALLLGCVLLPMLASTARAQTDLGTRFMHARLRRIAAEKGDLHGMRLQPQPPVPLPSNSEAWIRFKLASQTTEKPTVFVEPLRVDSVWTIRKLERPVFASRFADTKWAFMQGRSVVALDTARTNDIRARLEAHFGPPTRTLAEVDDVRAAPSENLIEFEYWFIVNDSIPVVLIDVNGPLERGVVTVTDVTHESRMEELRSGLLNRLFESELRAAYVDYFFNVSTQNWYATGFDGASFFHQRIGPPNMILGRPTISTYVKQSAER